MKIFFISNGVWEFDGRLRELVTVASELGNIKYISRVKNTEMETVENHIKISDDNYLVFIIKTFIEGLRFKNIDILFLDNRKSIIPGLLLKVFKKPKKTILDVRELYLLSEVKHIKGKIGCFFEEIMIKRADIVIAANKYRAELMKDYYKLETMPIDYENIRKLEYSKDFKYDILNEKYDYIFNKNSFKIISTSGCSVSRTNDILVEAVGELGNEYELLLVGGGTERDNYLISNIIKEHKLDNIHLIGKVEEDELKFLISKSHLGIVNYHQEDTNNMYCASGKIYEFVFEGIPVVTTENKPLLDLVNRNEIGVSDNEYFTGISKVRENYNFYKLQVNKFNSNISVEANNNELIKVIKQQIGLTINQK